MVFALGAPACDVATLPSVNRFSVAVVDGSLSLSDFSRDAVAHKELFHALAPAEDDEDQWVSLTSFALCVFRSVALRRKYFKQVVINLGMWLDALLGPQLKDGTFDAATSRGLAVLDGELADDLALGAVDDDEEKAGEVDVGAVVRHAAAFGVCKNFDLVRRQVSILRRLFWASRDLHRGHKKRVITVDASRFGTDTLVGLIGASSAGGDDFDFQVTYPPPQDLRV